MAAKGLSDAAKLVFAEVKKAHDAGEEITAKQIVANTGLAPRQVTGIITMCFCKKGIMERAGQTGDKDRAIVLLQPDFDPDFVPSEE